MKSTWNWRWGLVFVALVVMVGVLGCSVVGLPTLSAASDTPLPRATPAENAVAPMTDEADAVSALESQIIAVYEAVGPSVVNITNRSYAYSMLGRAVPQEGTGSGFVVDAEGHIVTNYHVVENAEELLVTLADGEVYRGEVIGTDPANDLAVIRIDAGENLPTPVPLADSDTLRVGQFVLAIGNPFGLEQTLTTGVVSALGRVIESPEDDRFIGEVIQTDAAINPGNSGGPLLDLKGQVIGVNSQIVSTSGSSSGVGFAISSNTLRRVVPELIAQGTYPHPWLGAQFLALTPSVAEVLREAGMDVGVESGLLVLEAVEDGPADTAGIQGGSRPARIGGYRVPLGGDIITAIDGQPVDSFQALTVYLETQTRVGDMVELTVIRGREMLAVRVTLEARPQM